MILSGVSRLARFRSRRVVLETEEEDVPPAQHRRVDSSETTEEPSNANQPFSEPAPEPSLSGQYVPEQTDSPTVLETPVPEQSIPGQTGGPTSDKTATGKAELEREQTITGDTPANPSSEAGQLSATAVFVPSWQLPVGCRLDTSALRADWVRHVLPQKKCERTYQIPKYNVPDVINSLAVHAVLAAHATQRYVDNVKTSMGRLTAQRNKLLESQKYSQGFISRIINERDVLLKDIQQRKQAETKLSSQCEELKKKNTELLLQSGAELECAWTSSSEVSEKLHAIEGRLQSTESRLEWSEATRRFLMTDGIVALNRKFLSSDEFGLFIGDLVPDLEVQARSDIIEQLLPQFFPTMDLKKVLGYMKDASSIAEKAFEAIQFSDKKFLFFDSLVANPDMGIG